MMLVLVPSLLVLHTGYYCSVHYYTELIMMTKIFSFILQIIIFWLSSACTHKEFLQSFPLTFNNDEHNADTTKVSQRISNLIKERNYLKTGTTIVGICCADGVVLGADTRCTGGPLIVDKNKLKIHTIASRIFCCAAGTSAQCDQVTRQAAQYLALLRVEKEIAGDTNCYDDIIAAALVSIKNSLRGPESNKRKLESVYILGGVDAFGPSLFQIDASGAVNQVGFASLGSGSMDALAVLESARFHWLGREHHGDSAYTAARIAQTNHSSAFIQSSDRSSYSNSPSPYLFSRTITVSDAVPIVRRAVRAGILNDLGSGSHVDLCVVSCDNGVRRWREQLHSSWEKDKAQEREVRDRSVARHGDGVGDRAVRLQDGGMTEVKESLSSQTTSSMHQNNSFANTIVEGKQEHGDVDMHGVLGRKVFSRRRLMRILQGNEVKELRMQCNVENDLSMEVEVL